MIQEITSCRICDGPITSILNFGEMPLANRYLKSLDEEDIHAPLEVVLCKNCGCVQLAHTVDPKLLFSDYLYTSSTSGSLKEYFRQYAQDTVDKLGWKPGDEKFIVGIGGNDGVLEKAYQAIGFNVLNVEASNNIAALSRANGVPTWSGWFTEHEAKSIANDSGQADLITCNHCFAHMPDINGVVRAIKILLKPGGTFIFEEAYWLDTVSGNHFDQIYHEHIFYWTLKALDELFYRHGMQLSDVEFLPAQGGSIRGFVRCGTGRTNYLVGRLVREAMSGVLDPPIYKEWWGRIMEWRTKCRRFIGLLSSFSCYGAPAKFTMISQQLGFTHIKREIETIPIQYVVEDSPIKIRRFTPGSHIPIVNRQHFIDHPTKHCIVTAANYADLIVKNNPQYKGKWIVLTPEPKLAV